MKRISILVPALLLVGALAAPALQAQGHRGKGQGQQLRKRDQTCDQTGKRGQGVRKHDGTGPRDGTADCPKVPKAPAK